MQNVSMMPALVSLARETISIYKSNDLDYISEKFAEALDIIRAYAETSGQDNDWIFGHPIIKLLTFRMAEIAGVKVCSTELFEIAWREVERLAHHRWI